MCYSRYGSASNSSFGTIVEDSNVVEKAPVGAHVILRLDPQSEHAKTDLVVVSDFPFVSLPSAMHNH